MLMPRSFAASFLVSSFSIMIVTSVVMYPGDAAFASPFRKERKERKQLWSIYTLRNRHTQAFHCRVLDRRHLILADLPEIFQDPQLIYRMDLF